MPSPEITWLIQNWSGSGETCGFSSASLRRCPATRGILMKCSPPSFSGRKTTSRQGGETISDGGTGTASTINQLRGQNIILPRHTVGKGPVRCPARTPAWAGSSAICTFSFCQNTLPRHTVGRGPVRCPARTPAWAGSSLSAPSPPAGPCIKHVNSH